MGTRFSKEERIPRLKDFLPSHELELVRDSSSTLSARFSVCFFKLPKSLALPLQIKSSATCNTHRARVQDTGSSVCRACGTQLCCRPESAPGPETCRAGRVGRRGVGGEGSFQFPPLNGLGFQFPGSKFGGRGPLPLLSILDFSHEPW